MFVLDHVDVVLARLRTAVNQFRRFVLLSLLRRGVALPLWHSSQLLLPPRLRRDWRRLVDGVRGTRQHRRLTVLIRRPAALTNITRLFPPILLDLPQNARLSVQSVNQ